MGCWSLPDTKEKKKKLKAIIKDVQKIKDKIYGVYGDDELFDCFDIALEMLGKMDKTPLSKIKKWNAKI